MPNCYRSGFSLLEVLIAIIILAVGVLGTLTLLLATLRMAQTADAESVALQLATDMADRLRTSAGSVEALRLLTQFDYDTSVASTMPAPVFCDDRADSCNAEQLAASDLHAWSLRIKARLPGGRVRICRDPAPWQPDRGTWRWECAADGMASNNAPLWIKLGWQERGMTARPSATSAPQFALLAD